MTIRRRLVVMAVATFAIGEAGAANAALAAASIMFSVIDLACTSRAPLKIYGKLRISKTALGYWSKPVAKIISGLLPLASW